MKATTARQRQVLRAIHKGILAGLPPTLSEIGAALKIAQPSAVFCHVRALEQKGLLERRARSPRALALTDAGRRELGVAP